MVGVYIAGGDVVASALHNGIAQVAPKPGLPAFVYPLGYPVLGNDGGFALLGARATYLAVTNSAAEIVCIHQTALNTYSLLLHRLGRKVLASFLRAI